MGQSLHGKGPRIPIHEGTESPSAAGSAGAAAGESFIYGSYASLRIEEPLSGKVYMNTALKNGEVKLVPSTQTYVDDFPAFYDSVNGLFVKLAEAIDGRDAKWVKAAAAAPDIDKQINDTRELFKLCK